MLQSSDIKMVVSSCTVNNRSEHGLFEGFAAGRLALTEVVLGRHWQPRPTGVPAYIDSDEKAGHRLGQYLVLGHSGLIDDAEALRLLKLLFKTSSPGGP